MPLEEKHKITEDELMFGLLLLNRYWFLKFFWGVETTIPENRVDLPEEWRGTQRITKEQRLMALDESENILFCFIFIIFLILFKLMKPKIREK